MKVYKNLKTGKILFSIDKNMENDAENLTLVKANTVDAAAEKHVPVYEINEDSILVTVGSVMHPMEEKHYIMWIAMATEDKVIVKTFKPGDVPQAKFKYVKGAKLYSFCNLHSLWEKIVE